MDNIYDYLQLGISCLVAIVGFIFFCVQIFKTGNIKKSIIEFEEFLGMSKKIKHNSQDYTQQFSDTVPDYILDPVSNELERSPIDKNIQQYIQSYIDVALDRALEKFLPDKVVEDDLVADYTEKHDDLCVLADSINLAEDYRERYKLPDSYSVVDIYNFIDKEASSLKSKLQNLNNKKGDVNNGESKT